MSEEFRSCPGLGYSPSAMVFGWLRSFGKEPAWEAGPDRRAILTHHGRTGIGLLCDMLGLGAGDEVLMPAYNCGAEVDPFVQAKCDVGFYRIDREARVDVEDVKSRLSLATKVVYISHFFGWTQDLGDLAEFCEQRKILLVEDCAQALFDVEGDNRCRRTGDAVIYSFGKFLAVPDGGAVIVKQGLVKNLPEMQFPDLRNTFRSSLPLFKKWFMQRISLWQRFRWSRELLNRSRAPKPEERKGAGRTTMLSSNRLDESRKSWRMARVSTGAVKGTDLKHVVSARRRNYACLDELLKRDGELLPLHKSLPDGVCPFAYPVFAKDPDHARISLENRGILVQGWPGYYPGMPWEEFPDACHLKDSLLLLPTHQDLSLDQMRYIADCANCLDAA